METRSRTAAEKSGTCLERPFGNAVERHLKVEVGWLGHPAFVKHASVSHVHPCRQQSCSAIKASLLACGAGCRCPMYASIDGAKHSSAPMMLCSSLH